MHKRPKLCYANVIATLARCIEGCAGSQPSPGDGVLWGAVPLFTLSGRTPLKHSRERGRKGAVSGYLSPRACSCGCRRKKVPERRVPAGKPFYIEDKCRRCAPSVSARKRSSPSTKPRFAPPLSNAGRSANASWGISWSAMCSGSPTFPKERWKRLMMGATPTSRTGLSMPGTNTRQEEPNARKARAPGRPLHLPRLPEGREAPGEAVGSVSCRVRRGPRMGTYGDEGRFERVDRPVR
jgi:hypothetical protein